MKGSLSQGQAPAAGSMRCRAAFVWLVEEFSPFLRALDA